ncbi:MAG: lipoate--protein ligase family protein [Acidobacteriota bacterium]
MICSEGCTGEQAAFLECRIDPFRTGLRNMSIDRELLHRAEASTGPMTWVRLYGWHPPAVSIGSHQDPETAVAAQVCALRGIDIVRRPTGGRAVFHDREVTYAVVSNDPVLVGGGITAAYRRVAEALQAGLRAVGVETQMARGEPAPEGTGPGSHPCFASASRHELLVEGRKIAGSAQRRLRRAFLQHGSIPLQIDYPLMADLLGCSEAFLRRRMISVSEAAGRPVSFRELAESLQAAFRERFGLGSG